MEPHEIEALAHGVRAQGELVGDPLGFAEHPILKGDGDVVMPLSLGRLDKSGAVSDVEGLYAGDSLGQEDIGIQVQLQLVGERAERGVKMTVEVATSLMHAYANKVGAVG